MKNNFGKNISSKSCAKIILSGEYSALYKKPILIIPIKKYLFCEIQQNNNIGLTIDLFDLNIKKQFEIDEINKKGELLSKKYDQYLKSEIVLNNFLTNYFDLPSYILYLLQKEYKVNLNGIHISIKSDIPINYGFGSSAAFIVAFLRSLVSYFKLNIDEELFLNIAINAENIVHIKSSGADVKCVFYKKTISFCPSSEIKFLNIRNSNFYIIYTGAPKSTTAQCIDFVKDKNIKENIWNKFARVTNRLEKALIENNFDNILESIKQNHQLLSNLGVVPVKIQNFIKEIEEKNGAGKISGAGSIKNGAAGATIVFIKDSNFLKEICLKYRYRFEECYFGYGSV